jgi:hypothetical protein
MPFASHAQEAAASAPGFFGKIGDWFAVKGINAIVLMIGAMLGSGFTLAVKKYAKIGQVVFHSIETVSGKLEDVCNNVDKMIKDDGKIDANSIQDVIDSGKGVKTEVGNVVVTFTPKKP